MAGTLGRRSRHGYVFPAMLVLLYAWIAVVTAWLADDSFISLRQVLNAVEGDGFTWNYGQRVQAFTHPSWVLLLTLVVAVTRELYLTTIVLSIVLSLASIVFLIRYATTLPEGRSTPLFLSAFLVVLAFSKAFTDYMTSGLENPLSFFLIGFVIWRSSGVTVDTPDRSRWVLFAALALAFLNRFDYAVLLLPLALHLMLTVPRGRLLRAVGPGAVLMAGWASFSLVYFGTPLPNTFYAKLLTGYPIDSVLAHGAGYFAVGMLQDPVTAVLIACGVIAGFVVGSRLARALSLGIVLYAAYVLSSGGDFMQGRFFAVLAYIAIFNLIALDQRTRATHVLKVAFLLLASAAAAFGPKPLLSSRTYRNLDFAGGVADERGVWYEAYGLLSPGRDWPPIAPRATGPPTEYRVTCIGRDGLVYRDVFLIDMCGLTDGLLSRLPAVRSRDWRAGHHFRKIPTDYGEAMVGLTAGLRDPALQPLFDDVQEAITGPLFTLERLRAIVRLNVRRSYGYDRDYYTDPAVHVPWSSLEIRMDYAAVDREPPEDGSRWLVPVAEGVVWPQGRLATHFHAGLAIVVQPAIPTQRISLSLDGNDVYRVILNSGEHVSLIERSSLVGDGGGLVSHLLELPDALPVFLIEIEPVAGDGYYGLGHLRIERSR